MYAPSSSLRASMTSKSYPNQNKQEENIPTRRVSIPLSSVEQPLPAGNSTENRSRDQNFFHLTDFISACWGSSWTSTCPYWDQNKSNGWSTGPPKRSEHLHTNLVWWLDFAARQFRKCAGKVTRSSFRLPRFFLWVPIPQVSLFWCSRTVVLVMCGLTLEKKSRSPSQEFFPITVFKFHTASSEILERSKASCKNTPFTRSPR